MSSSKFNYGGNTFNSSEASRPSQQIENPFGDQQTSNPFADTPPAYQSGPVYSPGSARQSETRPSYRPEPRFEPFQSLYPGPTGPGYAQAVPRYTPAAPISSQAANPTDDPYAFLTTFDTVFLIDDSGSMQGARWNEVSNVLKSITPICTTYDVDGIDIYFLNNPKIIYHVTEPRAVDSIFKTVLPTGSTPIGTRLHAILHPYVHDLQRKLPKKPLNIIVITDGAATDDPESVIVDVAKKLDALQASPWQVGIQFFQVGDDCEAAKVLKELDDALVDMGCKRDMVDTVPSGAHGGTLNADLILKTVLGGVHRRLDRKKAA